MDDITNKEMIEMMERMQRITRELERSKRALVAMMNGVPFTESFDEELYMEDADPRDTAYSQLVRMIEHLLKLKYCTNSRSHKKWLNEIRSRRDEAVDIMKWVSKKKKVTCINYITDELSNIYDDAVVYYRKGSTEYSDLRLGLVCIPEECPWSLDELMNDSIAELLEKLPDHNY